MSKYPIKIANYDFEFSNKNLNAKGSMVKRAVVDNQGAKAFFKYEGYLASESCSEKISYEIAKILGYDCAKIELAKDENGTLGVLNYLFVNSNTTEHIDAVAYLNIHEKEREKFYTLTNIKNALDKLDKNLFKSFIRTMIFDALIGEQDRHEENWGVEKSENKYEFSPLYDNGCSLLRNFKDENYAKLYYNQEKDFDAYINRSKTMIYKEESKSRYKHFELIELLKSKYSDIVIPELVNLKKLTDEIIKDIVFKIPDDLLTEKHKKYIVLYLIKRRNILLAMIGE